MLVRKLFNLKKVNKFPSSSTSKLSYSKKKDEDDDDLGHVQVSGDFPEFEAMKNKLNAEYEKTKDDEVNPDDIELDLYGDKKEIDPSTVPEDKEFYRAVQKEPDNPKYKEWKKEKEKKLEEKAKYIVEYPALFRDARGEENIKLFLRGDAVCIIIGDDFQYSGEDFHCLESPVGYHKIIIDTYNLYRFSDEGYLTNFSLEFELPIKVTVEEKVTEGAKLTVQIQVDHQFAESQRCRVFLNYNDKVIESSINDTMDLSLTNLFSKLPKTVEVKCCWSCGWSGYNPMSRNHFGGLGCFVDKEHMLNKKDPTGIYDSWNSDKARDVPENHYCDKYTKRKSNHIMPLRNEMKGERLSYDFE